MKISWADWTIDKIVCKQGDRVRITLTNLGSKILDLTKDEWAWKVQSEEEYYRGSPLPLVVSKNGGVFVEDNLSMEIAMTGNGKSLLPFNLVYMLSLEIVWKKRNHISTMEMV